MAGSAITLDLDARAFLRSIAGAGGSGSPIAREIAKAFRSIGAAFVSKQKRERLRGGGGKGSLNVRTGNLMRSIGHLVTGGSIEDLALIAGFGAPAQAFADNTVEIYANVHASPGGTDIKAKNVEYLAIPIADNKTSSGVARIDSPRELGDARFVPWRGDTFLVFDGDQLMFKLQREVHIDQTLDIPGDWQRFTPTVMKKLKEGLARAIEKMNKGAK